jgi:disulfide bond formation protein DsbB
MGGDTGNGSFSHFSLVLESAGHCSDILWTFMGLSIAEWSFLGFAGLGAAGTLGNLYPDQCRLPLSSASGCRSR